jgi:septum formation protein
MTPSDREIILASASLSRRKLLAAAGVTFRIMPANIDEDAIKRDHTPLEAGFDELAARLATRKALAIAERYPGALVIGADQILVCEGEALGKPDNVDVARQQLLRLRGRSHCLETAVACVRGNDLLWSHVEAPQLIMREFSPESLEAYLAAEGPSVTQTVGGYKIEGRAIQLFERLVGDYFAILGLPLLPLLEFLRAQGAVTT